MRVLILEEEAPLASFLQRGLEAEGYCTEIGHDEAAALALAREHDYDAMILDLSGRGPERLSLLGPMREARPGLPVLVLTSGGRAEERAMVLNGGADDCLTKPFAFAELLARMRGLLRRTCREEPLVLTVGGLKLDRVRRQAERDGRTIEFTAREFTLLEFLMRNAGRKVTRAMILREVWRMSPETTTNVVDVYINYLRKKVDGEQQPKLIRTIRGVGYEITAAAVGA